MSHRLRLRAGAIAWSDRGDEIVALDLEASEYVELNPSATVLMRLLDKGSSRSDLAAALVEAFEIDRERAEVDSDAFLGECHIRGWLE